MECEIKSRQVYYGWMKVIGDRQKQVEKAKNRQIQLDRAGNIQKQLEISVNSQEQTEVGGNRNRQIFRNKW